MTRPYLPAAIPEDLVEGVVGLVDTPSVFCKLHKVQDKDSKRPIPFDPLPMQRRIFCLLYTSPSPRDVEESRMPSSA